MALPDDIDAPALRAAVARAWPGLTRDAGRIERAAEDPKLEGGPPWPVYVPRGDDLAAVEARIRAAGGDPTRVRLLSLPVETGTIAEHGLLWLPGPYVVPGGRFNELYGWDSWFIQRGLARSGEASLSASMYEQARYEIEHYGRVLNANRSYYLSRTQPPLFTRMLRDALGAAPEPDALARGLRAALRYHALWVGSARHDSATGLARYRDDGHGPAAEVLAGEIDAEGRDHYDRVALRLEAERRAGRDVSDFLDAGGRLTALAYLGDRSMREGGFDASDRFGPLSLDIVRFAPVCLNTLLVVYERDLGWALRRLGDDGAALRYEARAEARAEALVARTWDEDEGLFLDWHLERGARSDYPFATTFWPLWAGLASPARADRVRGRLPVFERPGGLVASPHRTGCQWDAPFAWAPLQLFAVGGLHRYGFEDDARRVALAFVRNVQADFQKTGTFKEKYDAERMSADLEGQLVYGYDTNETGFGWTNAVVLELLDYLERGELELP